MRLAELSRKEITLLPVIAIQNNPSLRGAQRRGNPEIWRAGEGLKVAMEWYVQHLAKLDVHH